jgi:hypothetical protein
LAYSLSPDKAVLGWYFRNPSSTNTRLPADIQALVDTATNVVPALATRVVKPSTMLSLWPPGQTISVDQPSALDSLSNFGRWRVTTFLNLPDIDRRNTEKLRDLVGRKEHR